MDIGIIPLLLLNNPVGNAMQVLTTVGYSRSGNNIIEVFVTGYSISITVCILSGFPLILRNVIMEAINCNFFANFQTCLQILLELVLRQTAYGHFRLDCSIGIIQRHAQIFDFGIAVQRNTVLADVRSNSIIAKDQISDCLPAVVLQTELVNHRLIGIHIAVVTGVCTVLVTGLGGGHGGVNDLDIGLNAEVGSGTVTLYVEEVKVVNLTVHQTALGGSILQIDGNLGNGVSTAHIHDTSAVDVQINVVITGEGEVLICIFIVYELCVTFQRQIVVRGIVERTPIRYLIDLIVVGVAGQTVAQYTDTIIIAGAQRVKTMIRQCVASDKHVLRETTIGGFCIPDGRGLGILNGAIHGIIFGVIIGGVKDVVGIALTVGLLQKVQRMIVVDAHAVAVAAGFVCIHGAVAPDVMQQEVGNFKPVMYIGVIVQFAIHPGFLEFIILCLKVSFIGVVSIVCANLLAELGSQIDAAKLIQLVTHDVRQVIFCAIRDFPFRCHCLLKISGKEADGATGIARLAICRQSAPYQIIADESAVSCLLDTRVKANGYRFGLGRTVPSTVVDHCGIRDICILFCCCVQGLGPNVRGFGLQQTEAEGIAGNISNTAGFTAIVQEQLSFVSAGKKPNSAKVKRARYQLGIDRNMGDTSSQASFTVFQFNKNILPSVTLVIIIPPCDGIISLVVVQVPKGRLKITVRMRAKFIGLITGITLNNHRVCVAALLGSLLAVGTEAQDREVTVIAGHSLAGGVFQIAQVKRQVLHERTLYSVAPEAIFI